MSKHRRIHFRDIFDGQISPSGALTLFSDIHPQDGGKSAVLHLNDSLLEFVAELCIGELARRRDDLNRTLAALATRAQP